jgi:hypothetical protein
LHVLRLHPQSGDQVEATLPPSSFCRVPRTVRGTMLSDDLLAVHAPSAGERTVITLLTLRDAGYRVRVVPSGSGEWTSRTTRRPERSPAAPASA